jgi:DNA-binding IclR family transcriptional regulator
MSVNDELDELDMRILDAIVEITKEWGGMECGGLDVHEKTRIAKTTVYYRLYKLKRLGLITFEPRKARTVRIIQKYERGQCNA